MVRRDYDPQYTTRIPNDFILDKAQLTQEEVQVRFALSGWSIFHKGPVPEGHSVTPQADAGFDHMAEFGKRLLNIRTMFRLVGESEINCFYATKFNETFPGVVYAGGLAVESIADFARVYAENPVSPKMRETDQYTLRGLWGTGNAWAKLLAGACCRLLQTGKLLVTCVMARWLPSGMFSETSEESL